MKKILKILTIILSIGVIAQSTDVHATKGRHLKSILYGVAIGPFIISGLLYGASKGFESLEINDQTTIIGLKAFSGICALFGAVMSTALVYDSYNYKKNIKKIKEEKEVNLSGQKNATPKTR